MAALVENGQSTGELVTGDVYRIGTVLFATLQGLATMANTKMIDPLQDELIAYAIDSLLKAQRHITSWPMGQTVAIAIENRHR